MEKEEVIIQATIYKMIADKVKKELKKTLFQLGVVIGFGLKVIIVIPMFAILIWVVIHWFMLWYNGFDLLIEFFKTIL